jgi:hypothetical protein
VDVTQPVSIRIDEVVLDGVEDGAAAAELVQAEVSQALGRQPVQRADEVAAEVGRAVEASVRP